MEPFLLHQYQTDRRKLLEFIICSGLAGGVRPPPGAQDLCDVDIDALSADHVLECVKSGGMLDLSEAADRYREELSYPVFVNLPSRRSFYLTTESEASGSPPRHLPPHVNVDVNSYETPCSLEQSEYLISREFVKSRMQSGGEDADAALSSCAPLKDLNILSLGLPTLVTGLSNDDLRETAYELLLTFILLHSPVQFAEGKKEKRKSRVLMGLRSKTERFKPHVQITNRNSELLDTIRVQMEISEAMHACIKNGLVKMCINSRFEQIDVPRISLELLSIINKSDFLTGRQYMQWQKRQVQILEELLPDSADHFVAEERTTIRHHIQKLRHAGEWVRMGPAERSEILTSIKGIASRVSHMPEKFGLPGETYYWTGSYHFNLRLYEKLLYSVFDTLEEGQFIKGAEEILSALKLTWSTLGITQKIHDSLFSLVLLQQFIATGETMLLRKVVVEMQKVISHEDADKMEVMYTSSLLCSIRSSDSQKSISLVQSVFLSIHEWCNHQLQDYHLNFNEKTTFESVVTLAVVLGECLADDCGTIKFGKGMPRTERTSEILKQFVESSTIAAYRRVVDLLDTKLEVEKSHPLAVLAEKLTLVAEKESSTFTPVLCGWYGEAGIISCMQLHQFYGEQLKPFLQGVSNLSQSARSVLPAADILEHYLIDVLSSNCQEEGMMLSLINKLHPYQIGDFCGPLILNWVNAQHNNILKWTERAILIEDWEPLSSQQRQAKSIIEVFRIIDETIDQFFNMNLPMDVIHLRSLLIGIVQSLDCYLQHLVSQLVDTKHLFPNAPALTRYKETANPLIKKKSITCLVTENKVANLLESLTASKLCVKLNTLHYIQEKLSCLEDAITKSWLHVRPVKRLLVGARTDELHTSSDSIGELFTVFDDIRMTSSNASKEICDFLGVKIVFWDMRDSLLFSLYRCDVENSCLETNISQLDEVLNRICDLLTDTLRDQVVLSICRATMEGYQWVLLDGGPSRVFSETDVFLMKEDLNALKDLFIANGEGLPSVVVEKEAELTEQILDLYSLETNNIIEMLIRASEQMYNGTEQMKTRCRSVTEADTLLRILCHRKDKESSKFLKRQYQLPKSSDYEDTPGNESSSKSPLISDLMKRSASFHWTETGQRSLQAMKQRLREATLEIKYAPW